MEKLLRLVYTLGETGDCPRAEQPLEQSDLMNPSQVTRLGKFSGPRATASLWDGSIPGAGR